MKTNKQDKHYFPIFPKMRTKTRPIILHILILYGLYFAKLSTKEQPETIGIVSKGRVQQKT